jgi:AcrR family transcriptional regulator
VPRTKLLVNRHQLILESARTLFGMYGMERTTVEDIAKHAGISKGAIYLEFSNKNEIFIAIVKQFKDRELARMNVQVANATPPFLDALNAMLVGHIMRVYDHATSQVHSPEVMINTHKLVKSELNFPVAIRELIVQMLENARNYKEIAACYKDATRLADLLMASTSTLLPPYPQNSTIYRHEFWPRDRFESNAKELLEIFLAGLSKV